MALCSKRISAKDSAGAPFHLQNLVKRMAIAGYTDMQRARQDYDAFLAEQSAIQYTPNRMEEWVLTRVQQGLSVFEAQALNQLASELGHTASALKQQAKRALITLENRGKITKVGRGKYVLGSA